MKKRSFEAFPNIFPGRFAHSNSPNMTYRLKKDHNKLEFSRIYIGNPSMTDGHSLPGESPSIPRPTVMGASVVLGRLDYDSDASNALR